MRAIDADFGGATDVSAADLDGDGDVALVGAAMTDDRIAWWEQRPFPNLAFVPLVMQDHASAEGD